LDAAINDAACTCIGTASGCSVDGATAPSVPASSAAAATPHGRKPGCVRSHAPSSAVSGARRPVSMTSVCVWMTHVRAPTPPECVAPTERRGGETADVGEVEAVAETAEEAGTEEEEGEGAERGESDSAVASVEEADNGDWRAAPPCLACRGDEPVSPLPDVGVFCAADGIAAAADDDDDEDEEGDDDINDDDTEAVPAVAVVSPAQFGQNHRESRAARTRPSMPAHLW